MDIVLTLALEKVSNLPLSTETWIERKAKVFRSKAQFFIILSHCQFKA